MMDLEVKVELAGADALAEALRGAADEAATAMAAEIKAEAQRNVPVKSGDLKRSGKVEPSSQGRGSASVTYGDGKKVRYAAIVHELAGKGFMFLRNAAMRRKVLHEIAAKVFRQRMKDHK